MDEIRYVASPAVSDEALNGLFRAAWPEHRERGFQEILFRSLGWVCAFEGDRLVGFVNLAWDGGEHAFLLDTTVHPDRQRKGIGSGLVRRAAELAGAKGVRWLHVDFEPRLSGFYGRCGFRPTSAGLIRLPDEAPK